MLYGIWEAVRTFFSNEFDECRPPFVIFVTILDSHINMERKLLNRIKVVLAEKNRSNKWLSEQLDKDPAIISKWVTNTTQPNVETLIQISKVLGVTVDDLLRTE